MRITGGVLRGRVVQAPRRGDVRPSAERLREALFSMLGQDLSGRSALDLFAGAGMLGLEAWSRGAGPVTFVDRDPRVVRHLARSLDELGVPAALVQADAARFLARGGRYDLVLLDPPYAEPPQPWLERAAPVTRWRLVLEFRAGPELPERVGGLRQLRSRRYGDGALAVYAPEEPSEEPPEEGRGGAG